MTNTFLLNLKVKITSILVAVIFSFSSSFSFADTVNILGLFPFSGPYADSGKLTDQGARIALEEVNYTINGKKIKYVTRDSETKAGPAARRAQEAIDTGADEVAVACPFCYIMMDDGVKELGYGDNVKVRDVSLILLDNLKKD